MLDTRTSPAGAAALRWSLDTVVEKLAPWLAPVLAAGVPFALYLRTLAPTVYNIDSAEFATSAATWGVPHPPGYPLYTLLARAFVILPIGDVGYRVNLLSAIYAALSLYVLYLITVRLTRSKLAGVASAWMLGLSYPFWANSVVAEIYALDAVLFGSTMLFVLRWRDDRRAPDLLLAFAIFGLSLANRTTNILALPGILLFVLPDLVHRLRLGVAAMAAAIPGVALYGLLPFRAAAGGAYEWGSTYTLDARPVRMDLADPSRLWWYVTARVFDPLTQLYDWGDRAREAGVFGRDLWSAFAGGGVLLAAAGFVWLVRRDLRVAALLLAVAAPQAAFFVNYAAVDKDTMFDNVYVVVAILGGCGVALAMRPTRADGRPLVPQAALAAMLVLFAGVLVVQNFSLLDVSSDERSRQRGEQLFATAEPNAVVIGAWTDVAPLEYLQTVEHQRPDLALVQAWAVWPGTLRDMAAYNLERGRAVYAMRDEPFFHDGFDVVPEHDWFQLRLRSNPNE